MLTARVAAINQARRTPDAGANPPRPELCPTAHIAVNGHWEQATSNGALGHVVGRAGWILSALAGQQLAHLREILPCEMIEKAQACGQARSWWETIAYLLEELPRLGWNEAGEVTLDEGA